MERTDGMQINFCGKFIKLAKTFTEMNRRRQKAMQARQVAAQKVAARRGGSAMRGVAGSASGFQRPAGDFASATGQPSKERVTSTAVSKLIPFL